MIKNYDLSVDFLSNNNIQAEDNVITKVHHHPSGISMTIAESPDHNDNIKIAIERIERKIKHLNERATLDLVDDPAKKKEATK